MRSPTSTLSPLLLLTLLLCLFVSACDDMALLSYRASHAGQSGPVDRGAQTTEEDVFSTLSGRAVKGIVQHANISAFQIKSGERASAPIASALSDEAGQFSLKIPGWRFQQLIYLEISAAQNASQTSTMLCDAYSGCGLRNGVIVGYGDAFPLSEGVLMRNVARLRGGKNSLIGNFSPLRSMAVARAEVKMRGLINSNMEESEAELSQLFLLSKPIRELEPVNLLSASETKAASDEQLVLAILEASFLNIGVSPNYVAVEKVLSRLSALHGQFEEHESGNFNRLSFHNLLRAAYYNIPGSFVDRPGLKAHILRIVQARAPALAQELEGTGGEEEGVTLALSAATGGRVKVDPLGEICQGGCEYAALPEGEVVLIPRPDIGYQFDYWSGDCAGVTENCHLLMDRNKTTNAVFSEKLAGATTYSLAINIKGGGSTVEKDSSSLCAEKACSADLDKGQNIELLAQPEAGYTFYGWSGDCSGSGSCTLLMDGNKAVSAAFRPIMVELSITLGGGGAVRVGPIEVCTGFSCNISVAMGKTVSLVPAPASGFRFNAWGQDCTGSSVCELTMTSDKQVQASFGPVTHGLTLLASPGGAIVSADKSLVCSEPSCSFVFIEGAAVTFHAEPKAGYKFDSWAGACSGNGSCLVEMGTDVSVQAKFSPILHTLTVSVSEGGGVTSLAAGLSCMSGVCESKVPAGTTITLSGLPEAGYDISGWTGPCTNSAVNCQLTMNKDISVNVAFAPADEQGSIRIDWMAPDQREDGSALSAEEILCYTIYYGKQSGVYSHSQRVEVGADGLVPTSVTLRDLEKGVQYYVVGTTEDISLLSSQVSNEIIRVAN